MPNVMYSPSYQKKNVKRSVQCHVFTQLPKEDCKTFCPVSRIRPFTKRRLYNVLSNVTYSPSYQKKNVKPSVQCHVLTQSPTGRRPNNKYPVNTSHRSDLCKNVLLEFYLITTVIYIQAVHSQICVYVYTHIVHSTVTLVGQNI